MQIENFSLNFKGEFRIFIGFFEMSLKFLYRFWSSTTVAVLPQLVDEFLITVMFIMILNGTLLNNLEHWISGI